MAISAYEKPVLNISENAGADLSSSQYLFLKYSSGNVVVAGDGENGPGVLQNKPVLNDVASIMAIGITRVIASGVLAAGAEVASDAAGKAKAPATGDVVRGQLLQAAAADGDVVAMLLYQGGQIAP